MRGVLQQATLPPQHGAKKKASAVAGTLPLCSVACDWSQGPKRNVVTVAYIRKPSDVFLSWSHASEKKWLLLRGLLGRLLGRLSSFLLCHGAWHLLSGNKCTDSKIISQ